MQGRIFRAVWPLLLWMAFVFFMSTEIGAASNTGRVLVPILRWLNPAITDEAIERIHFIVRKCAHVTEYAVLALLVLRALRIWRDRPAGRWSWSLAFAALAISAAYAATDEIHQLWVPDRTPSLHDVMIDSAGAAIGLSLAFWRKPNPAAAT